MDRQKQNWSVADAKARFGEVIDRAIKDGPQIITLDGRTTAVVVSAEQWESEVRREGTLADFFAASPLKKSGLIVERSSDAPRDLEL